MFLNAAAQHLNQREMNASKVTICTEKKLSRKDDAKKDTT